MPARRFPPPWLVEEQDACFVVRDPRRAGARVCLFRGRAGTTLSGQAVHARWARRIAANFAKLPDLLRKAW